MSGHSHAKTIKHKKELTDKKRGQAFSKMASVISIVVKEKGPNPETNSKLKDAIEAAKSVNMPKENIERAIKRGTGEIAGENLETFTFEGYGPGGIAIITEGITNNRNRTLSEFKQILNQNKGKMVDEGSVRWMFDKKGVITIIPENQAEQIKKEDLELLAIDAGAEDFYWHDDVFEIYTRPEDLDKIKKLIQDKNIAIESSSLDWVAKETIKTDKETEENCLKLFEALDENDAIQDVYSNLRI